MDDSDIGLATPRGRWIVAAAVLGSGIAFLDSTLVNVALPAIEEDFDASLTGLQWIVSAYLVTLSALVLLGGSLGDEFGRRRSSSSASSSSRALRLPAVSPRRRRGS